MIVTVQLNPQQVQQIKRVTKNPKQYLQSHIPAVMVLQVQSNEEEQDKQNQIARTSGIDTFFDAVNEEIDSFLEG